MFLNIVSFVMTTHVSFYGNGVENRKSILNVLSSNQHIHALYTLVKKGHFWKIVIDRSFLSSHSWNFTFNKVNFHAWVIEILFMWEIQALSNIVSTAVF